MNLDPKLTSREVHESKLVTRGPRTKNHKKPSKVPRTMRKDTITMEDILKREHEPIRTYITNDKSSSKPPGCFDRRMDSWLILDLTGDELPNEN